jgi:hypothetical protein
MIAVIVVVQLALPVYLLYDVGRRRTETPWAWGLRAAAAAAYVGFVFLTGRWDLFGYYLRYVLIVALVPAAAIGFARLRAGAPVREGRSAPAKVPVGSIVTLLLFTALGVYALRGLWYEGEPVRLSSPLQGGAFYVGQGGDSALLNYHHAHATQRFALDILELNGAGTRAASLQPSRLDEYEIFGQPVRSPCAGRVVTAVDGLEDNVPPGSDADNAAGNHVVVGCHGVRVFLAHLQRGTVAVRAGDTVAPSDVVGLVGNSGNTSEPHLHVHAVRPRGDGGGGRPVPILVDGTFPVRNTILDE